MKEECVSSKFGMGFCLELRCVFVNWRTGGFDYTDLNSYLNYENKWRKKQRQWSWTLMWELLLLTSHSCKKSCAFFIRNHFIYIPLASFIFHQRSLFTKASATYQQEDIQTTIAINLTWPWVHRGPSSVVWGHWCWSTQSISTRGFYFSLSKQLGAYCEGKINYFANRNHVTTTIAVT